LPDFPGEDKTLRAKSFAYEGDCKATATASRKSNPFKHRPNEVEALKKKWGIALTLNRIRTVESGKTVISVIFLMTWAI